MFHARGLKVLISGVMSGSWPFLKPRLQHISANGSLTNHNDSSKLFFVACVGQKNRTGCLIFWCENAALYTPTICPNHLPMQKFSDRKHPGRSNLFYSSINAILWGQGVHVTRSLKRVTPPIYYCIWEKKRSMNSFVAPEEASHYLIKCFQLCHSMAKWLCG